MEGSTLLGVAAIITAIAAPVSAWLALKAKQSSDRVEVKVDGRLEELLSTLKAKGVVDESMAYAAGANDQRKAADGVVIVEKKDG